MFHHLKKLIFTGLGTGYLPIAPGTWGSGAVCVIFLAVAFATKGNALYLNTVMLSLAAVASVGCVALGRFGESVFGRKDASQCTLDEWAGQSLTLAFLPLIPSLPDWQSYLIVTTIAFVAFRIFDIFKPPPARQMEKIPFGWGVLLDDIIAAIYANILCQIILRMVVN